MGGFVAPGKPGPGLPATASSPHCWLPGSADLAGGATRPWPDAGQLPAAVWASPAGLAHALPSLLPLPAQSTADNPPMLLPCGHCICKVCMMGLLRACHTLGGCVLGARGHCVRPHPRAPVEAGIRGASSCTRPPCLLPCPLPASVCRTCGAAARASVFAFPLMCTKSNSLSFAAQPPAPHPLPNPRPPSTK